MKRRNKAWLLGMSLMLMGCSTDEKFKQDVEKTIKKNPEIVFKIIEENPTQFVETLQKAIQASRQQIQAKQEEEEKKALALYFEKPLGPNIRDDEAIRGNKKAPLTLVEYLDFECPYCARGHQTVKRLQSTYRDNIRVVYKHLPLSFHPNAMPAARYYEAIRLQDHQKAFRFYDEIFKAQSKLRNGEAFLKSVAKKVKADMKKLAQDLKSEKIDKRIAEDMQEASKFGFQGTPGYLLNGIPVKGAYPFEHFTNLVGELEKRGKVNL